MARTSETGAETSFLADVSRRVRVVDGLVLLAAPAVLLGLQALSASTRAELVFDRAAPSLLTAFTAHYVHLEAGHLPGNLAVYALVVPTVYLLFLLSGRRSEFLVVTATVLLAYPFVLTALDTLVLRHGTLVGFSGLAMAFVGVLPVATFLFLDDRTEPAVGLEDAPVLFFAGVTLIAIRVVPTGRGLAVAAVAAVLSLGYVVRIGRAVPRPSRLRVRGLLRRSGYLELALASPVVFGVAILAAFPADPVRSGSVVDLFGHLLGYSLGFLATYLTVTLDRAAGGSAEPVPPPPDPPATDEEDSPPPPADSADP